MKQALFAVAVMIAGAAAGAALAQDAGAGMRAFNAKCKTCHTVDKDGRHLVGPNLHGFLGTKAGSKAGFDFSTAMKGSAIVWDEKTFKEYVADPRKRVPENKMAFVGIKRESELNDIFAYLKEATTK